MSLITTDRATDVPADLPLGRHLGRTVNYEQAVGRFGRPAVNHLTDHFNIGDELGYRAFAALKQQKLGRDMWMQAIAEGVDAVEGAPPELVELFKHADTVPDWVDWEQLRRGSIAYWRPGKLVVMALAYAAIGAGFRTYGGSRELVLSRRLIDRDQVGRRLVETLRWAANASKPDGMRREGDGFRMTMEVRFIHAAVRYHCARDENWDWNDWGISVDNGSAIYTMGTLFSESVINALTKVGIKYSDQEIEDIVALWRYIGHIMGIPEDINFTDWADLRRKSDIIRMIEHPADDGCRTLMKSLTDFMCEETIEGYEVLPPFLDKRLGPDQKRRLTYGLMRGWAGDEICEQLAVPNNRLRVAVPMMRPFVGAYDWINRRRPSYDAEAAALRALEEFGVAIALNDGDAEVAPADDVVARLAANSATSAAAMRSHGH
jgi:hypothetical protein